MALEKLDKVRERLFLEGKKQQENLVQKSGQMITTLNVEDLVVDN